MSILKTNLNCFKQNGLYRFDDSLLNIFHQSSSEKEKVMQNFNLRRGTENISGVSRAALYDYTTDDAYGINFFLQTGQLRPGARYDSSFYQSFADDVYNALNEIPGTEGIFYRQIGFGGAPNSMFHRGKEDFINFAKFHKDNIGKVIEYPSFTSTSLIESSYTPKTPYRGALMIYGKNGKIIDNYSGYPTEYEALFNARSKFKVEDFDWININTIASILSEVDR